MTVLLEECIISEPSPQQKYRGSIFNEFRAPLINNKFDKIKRKG